MRNEPTPAQQGVKAVIANVVELAQLVSAGAIDSKRGIVVAATDAIPRWAGNHLVSQPERALSLPVSILNDVHAHGIGEAWTGAARGFGRSLMVAAGTGIGGACEPTSALDISVRAQILKLLTDLSQ